MNDAELNQEESYTIETLETDDDKFQRLNKLFEKRTNKDEIFIPDQEFYSESLIEMTNTLLDFIGMPSKGEELYVDYIAFDAKSTAAGLYTYSDGTHYIHINSRKAKDRYQIAAVLAHELMHFILLGVMKYSLNTTRQNEELTDIATIVCGFGVVVTNGFKYDSGWIVTVIALFLGILTIHTEEHSFGYYKPKEYAYLVKNIADIMRYQDIDYAGYFLPWTYHFLPSSLVKAARGSSSKSDAVAIAKKRVTKSNTIKIGVVLVIAVIFISFLRTSNNNSSSSSSSLDQTQASTLRASVASDLTAYNSCSTTVTNDNEQINATNSQMSKYSNAGNTDSYNALVPQQNAEVQQYNTDKASCDAVYATYSAAINSYNNYISRNK